MRPPWTCAYVRERRREWQRKEWMDVLRPLVSRAPHSHSQGAHRRSVALGIIVQYYLVQYVASYLNRKEMIFSLSCVGIVGGYCR